MSGYQVGLVRLVILLKQTNFPCLDLNFAMFLEETTTTMEP